TNGRLAHPDGSLSNWRRWGSERMRLVSGLEGVSGIPVLASAGTPSAGRAGSLSLSSARPLAPAVLFVALESAPAPFLGGVLEAWPFTLALPLTTDANGALRLSFTWPSGLPAGTPLWLQVAVQDPASPQRVSLSNALQVVTR